MSAEQMQRIVPRRDSEMLRGIGITSGRVPLLLPLLAAAVGILARVVLFPHRPNLWEDEIIAVTHAVQPLGRLLVNVARNDVHPPLYFIQLHLWAIASRADWWFVLNSVLWSFAALASVWHVVRRQTGDLLLAWTATGILAVLPTALEMAFAVRMYAMLSTLMIWSYYFVERAFGDRSRERRWPVVLINAVLVYTHAVGFLAVVLNGIYALLLLRRSKASSRAYFSWLVVFGSVGALALPVLVNDALRRGHLEPFTGVGTILAWMAGMAVDANPAGGTLWIGLGAAIFACLAVFGLINERTRALTASYLVAPLLIAIAAGLAAKPIFKADVFSTIASPFVAIIAARLILDASRNSFLRKAAFCTCAAIFGAMSAAHASVDTKNTNFGQAAAVVRADAQPGDTIYVPQLAMFWGLAWNLVGPNWGSPLAIAPKPNRQWQSVYRRLGEWLVARLHLQPRAQQLRIGSVTLLLDARALNARRFQGRLWVLTYPRDDLSEEDLRAAEGNLKERADWHFGFSRRLSLTLYEAPHEQNAAMPPASTP